MGHNEFYFFFHSLTKRETFLFFQDGRTAEYYLHNPDHVTHDQLMAEYERPASGGHAVTPAVTPAVSDRGND